MLDRVLVACDLKLREGLGQAVSLEHLPMLALFSGVYLMYFEVRACRDY